MTANQKTFGEDDEDEGGDDAGGGDNDAGKPTMALINVSLNRNIWDLMAVPFIFISKAK